MPTIVKNINDLQKNINKRIAFAMKNTQKVIYNCIQESINSYYSERVFRGGTSCIPSEYERTYKLLNSLIKTDVVVKGDIISCEVKIDDNYLNYIYPDNGGTRATGLDVITWNEQDGSHGGTISGNVRLWSDAMDSLKGENGIVSIFVNNLKKSGINIS